MREAQKHVDPVDPDPDPQHCYSGSRVQGSKRQRIPDSDPQHLLHPKQNNSADSVGSVSDPDSIRSVDPD